MTSASPVSTSPAAKTLWLPILALIGSMASLCIGTSFGKTLFPAVGAQGTTAYRITVAALILLVIWRPWRMPLSRGDAGRVVLYGVTLACLNLLFYMPSGKVRNDI